MVPAGDGWIAASEGAPDTTAQGPFNASRRPLSQPEEQTKSTSQAVRLSDQLAARAALEKLSPPAATTLTARISNPPSMTHEHAAVQGDGSVAKAASEVPDQIMRVAESKLDDLLVTKLEEMLAAKVNIKLDYMLDRKLDEILGRDTPTLRRAAKARAASSLLAVDQGGLDSLVSIDALRDPDFTPEHRHRQTFVGIRLDGKHIFPQRPEQHAHDGRTVHESVLAQELGLKITAIETRENKIGRDMSVRLDVETKKMKFRIWSSKAGMFKEPDMQVKYAHLNLNLLGPFPNHVGGFFAELRGKVPMSQRSKSFLRKEDRAGRYVLGKVKKAR